MSDKNLSDIESSDDETCPTCGKDDFSNSAGMFNHHTHKHGESLDRLRFWSKVDTGEEDECWEWTAGIFKSSGYGQFGFGEEKVLAHRTAYEFEVGGIGNNYVLHHCDNKLCVNPNHLYLGDQKDNIQDSIDRDLMPRGERRVQAKLTKEQVAEIRRRYAEDGEYGYEIARDYDISETQVHSILRGDTWAHTYDGDSR